MIPFSKSSFVKMSSMNIILIKKDKFWIKDQRWVKGERCFVVFVFFLQNECQILWLTFLWFYKKLLQPINNDE